VLYTACKMILGITLPYRSLAQPNTNDGIKTNAAHNGGWEIRCINANTIEVTILATLMPNQLLLNPGLPIRKACSPPRKTISSSTGTNNANFNSSSHAGGPFRGTSASTSNNQQTGPAISAA